MSDGTSSEGEKPAESGKSSALSLIFLLMSAFGLLFASSVAAGFYLGKWRSEQIAYNKPGGIAMYIKTHHRWKPLAPADKMIDWANVPIQITLDNHDVRYIYQSSNNKVKIEEVPLESYNVQMAPKQDDDGHGINAAKELGVTVAGFLGFVKIGGTSGAQLAQIVENAAAHGTRKKLLLLVPAVVVVPGAILGFNLSYDSTPNLTDESKAELLRTNRWKEIADYYRKHHGKPLPGVGNRLKEND
jgi:hypothetical protein